MKYTVLGAKGFIGTQVALLARRLGHDVFCPARDEQLDGRHLDHVIYTIGLTADFRTRPFDTVTAHVTKLQEILTRTSFDSLVYLSSTRVYSRCDGMATPAAEDAAIPVLSSDFSDLYNLSKLMGESIALASGPHVKAARLSNVFGPDFESDNFLTSVIRDCVQRGHVELRTSLESAKDYVAVEDVAEILLRLSTGGSHRIYNVASGVNTTHREIVERLSQLTGASVTVADDSPLVTFPTIDISRLRTDLNFTPRCFDEMLPALVASFRDYDPQQTSRV